MRHASILLHLRRQLPPLVANPGLRGTKVTRHRGDRQVNANDRFEAKIQVQVLASAMFLKSRTNTRGNCLTNLG